MTRIAIIVTSHDKKGNTGAATGAYVAEISHPYEAFVKAGHEVEFISPKGGQVPLDGVDRTDPANVRFLDNAELMLRLHQSIPSRSADASRYGAVFFAGGHGTMWDFKDDAPLSALAGKVYDAGGVVGAVCHGPAGLVNVTLASGQYLVDGKRVAAFTNDEERAVGLENVVPFLLADALTAHGATHVPAANWAKQVITDQRLVTGQNPASAGGVGEAMVALLGNA
jgi:putative intracellular protease/amidase